MISVLNLREGDLREMVLKPLLQEFVELNTGKRRHSSRSEKLYQSCTQIDTDTWQISGN